MVAWPKHGNAGAVCDIWSSAKKAIRSGCRLEACAPGLPGIVALLRGPGFWFHRSRARPAAEPDAIGGPSDLYVVRFTVHAARIRWHRQRVERALPDVAGLCHGRGNWRD